MNTEIKISALNPSTEITIAGEKLEVREMSWPAALKFLQLLSKYAGQFLDAKGNLAFELSRITDLVINAGELSELLILNSTGKDAAWLAALSFSDALEVLDVALAVNLSPEVLAKAKKPLGRFVQALGVKTAQTTTSPA